jgi:hypothetical protein
MNSDGYGCQYDSITGRWIAWFRYQGCHFQESFAALQDAVGWLEEMKPAAGIVTETENNHDRR